MQFIEIIVVALVGLMVLYYLFVLVSSWHQKGKLISDINGVDDNEKSSWQIYYFHSPNCGACRSISPWLNEQALIYPVIHCIDVAEQLDIARSFNVRATPTAVLVENGIISRVLLGTGLLNKLKAFIAKHEHDENRDSDQQ